MDLLHQLEQGVRNIRASVEADDIDSVNVSLDELKVTIERVEHAVDEKGVEGLKEGTD